MALMVGKMTYCKRTPCTGSGELLLLTCGVCKLCFISQAHLTLPQAPYSRALAYYKLSDRVNVDTT